MTLSQRDRHNEPIDVVAGDLVIRFARDFDLGFRADGFGGVVDQPAAGGRESVRRGDHGDLAVRRDVEHLGVGGIILDLLDIFLKAPVHSRADIGVGNADIAEVPRLVGDPGDLRRGP